MTHFPTILRRCSVFAAAGILSIFIIAPVQAQETTAVLNGIVYAADGTGKAGAAIEIVHITSGARWSATTNESGAYRASGLRPGGPYTVTLVGTDVRQENVYLNISEPGYVYLVERSLTLEEVVVTGTRDVYGVSMGTSTMIDSEALNAAATIARDFKNVIRQDPRVTLDLTNREAIGIGGVNNRYNSLTVDGVRQSDEFGVNQSGFPTQRTPISQEAIEQISVEVAPFSVEYGSFQGGTINIVTKSGDNDFHGSAFYSYSDGGLVGDKSEDRDINIGAFKEEYFGGTLSGPIIKDNIWFFFSYEKFEGSDTTATNFGVEGSGAANEIPGITQADVDLIRSISQDVYGFDPLSDFGGASLVEDEKWLGKIDWQISDSHTARFTYQKVTGNNLNGGFNSVSSQRLALPTNFYNQGEVMEAYSAQLFSNWTDALSTEFKFAVKDVDNIQDPVGGGSELSTFASMEVSLDADREIIFGPDQFRQANVLNTENFQLKLQADYAWRDHVFTVGFERDTVDTFNLFAPGFLGQYEFDSIEDFQNRRASNVNLTNISVTGDVRDLGATFKTAINSYYIQDKWDVRDNLVVLFGVRLDDYTNGESPFANANFTARNGFDNSATMDNREILMPRFGFNWQPRDRTTIRGGIGLFSGGVPTGFLSNAFSNVGILNMNGSFGSSDLEDIVVDGFNIDSSLIAQLQPGDGNVAAIDHDFDIPSLWKINLAWDQEFDLGKFKDFRFSVDALLAFVEDAPLWIDLRRELIGTAADGRPVYGEPGCAADPATVDPLADCTFIRNWDVFLTNTSKGRNHSYSVSLAKDWDFGKGGDFSSYVAYTLQDAAAVSDAFSSTPTSLMGREQTFDRNNPLLGRSRFENKHRINATFTWRKTFFEKLPTTLSFFFQAQSGTGYAYTYSVPSNLTRGSNPGDTFGGNEPIDDDDTQLIYVPTGADDPKVIFGSGFDMAGWEALVSSKSCLSDHRGKIVPKNHCSNPWKTRLDMRFIQEFRLPNVPLLGESSFEFFLDIENLGNLINSDWGRVEKIFFPDVAQVITLDRNLGPNGELIYNSFRDESFGVFNLPSLWKIQLGVRYNF